MHSQEPWQSRSPTGAVNKPIVSTTLMKTGRRGSNHSYGRGLPVKRKALVILSIAILAFAMIPALGAGAAAGDVKIVTPHELANPSGKADTAFGRLTGAEYVSDVTGGSDMRDTFGTLYAVIEDNDEKANAYLTYTAIFPASAEDNNGVTLSEATGAGFGVFPGSHAQSGLPAASTATPVPDADVADLNFADRSRNGTQGPEDVTIFVVDTGDDNALGGTGDDADEIRPLTATSVFSNAVGLSLTAVNIGGFTADIIRINFSSAGENYLRNPDGSSRVKVQSGDTGDSISIVAKEKSLTYLAGLQGAVTVAQAEADTADSKDSGVFIGSFGLIDDAWKEMIKAWANDDTADTDDTDDTNSAATVLTSTPSADINPVATPVSVDTVVEGNTITSRYADVRAYVIDVGSGRYIVAGDDEKIDHNDVSVEFTALTGRTHDGTDYGTISPTEDVSVAIMSLSARDTGAARISLECGVPTGSDQTAPTGTTTAANQRVACVHITVPADGTTRTESTFVSPDPPADPASPVTITAYDKVTFSFVTESNVGTLLAEVVKTEDRHEAFKDLEDAAAAAALDTALRAHARNLNVAVTSDAAASALVGRLLGTRVRDSIEVRYSDESPNTLQRETAIVDLTPPIIGGLNPADNSYTTDNNFDMLLTVTDAAAGIPEDAHEETVGSSDIAMVSVGEVEATDATATATNLDETREVITDGYQYDMDVTVTRDDDSENVNVVVTIPLTAYDLAGNKATKTVTYTIDTKDPELLGALTGVGAKANSDLDRKDAGDELGAYELVLNDPRWIALVFDDAINGAELDPAEVIIAGQTVESVLWLDGSGQNVITTGAGDNSASVISGSGSGLNLDVDDRGQLARHVLFVRLDADLGTADRPAVEIDADDLEDLAGNRDRSDHQLTRAHDRLAPILTVTVTNPLSNDRLDVTIESSEDLDREPSAKIAEGDRRLNVSADGDRAWSIGATAKSIGQTTSGVRTIVVNGEDADGNKVENRKAKWELDVIANRDVDPIRGGTTAAKNVAEKIETNEVVFLNVTFGAEANEYDDDSKKTVAITGLSLETLAADAIKKDNTIVAKPTVDTTTEVDAASAQTSDGIKHVVALADLAIGNYRLNIDYEDVAGNTGEFPYVFKIVAPAPAEIDVVPGWSLVSIPGSPVDSSIGGVFEGSAVTDVWSLRTTETGQKEWQYAQKDEETGEWMGTLTQIVDGRAYFVRSTTFDPIKVLTARFNPQRTPPQYVVATGWNGIGYTPAGGETAISVDGYLSSLGASGWGMIRTWNSDASPPQYETYYSSGAMTDGFPTGDGPDGDGEGDNPDGSDGDSVGDGVAKVEAGKGYLLFATRGGIIGG